MIFCTYPSPPSTLPLGTLNIIIFSQSSKQHVSCSTDHACTSHGIVSGFIPRDHANRAKYSKLTPCQNIDQNMYSIMLIIVFHQQNAGLPEKVCLRRYPGPPPQHHLRLLEDGLGDELLLYHYAHKPSGEEQGTGIRNTCTYHASIVFN